jgi:GR25 family glycosyltransferase involved in LPS biosynthesis
MTSPNHGFWDCLDAVLVINLDHRTDRWDEIRNHLTTIVPAGKLHRLPAVLGRTLPGYGDAPWFRRTKRAGTWGGRAGCMLSHRNALRLARERGWRRVLILEDDARIALPLQGETGRELAAFLERESRDYGVLFLGFTSPRKPVRPLLKLKNGPTVFQVSGCSTTHAYVVDTCLYDKLLASLPSDDRAAWAWVARHVAIDRWYSLHLDRLTRVAALSPQAVIQGASFSDITERQADYHEEPAADLLTPLQSSPATWPVRHAFARLVRSAGDIRRILKGWLRRIRGL